MSTTTDRSQTVTSKGTIPANLQLSLSDQLYRQSKIDEENRRLKKKSKADGGSSSKGKKSSKKSDTTTADDIDEDLYPTIKVTCGGELPEGVTESGNEDNENDEPVRKNKKYDPHRALNINFDEKPPTPTIQIQEPIPKPIENPPSTTEKAKKPKKKKTTEKEEKLPLSKSKQKRERSDYKELLSPADEEEKRVVTPVTSTTTTAAATTEEKPKKKKAKEKKSTDNKTSAPLLFDMMSDDINPTDSSNQQYNEPNAYKLAAQSDNLTIVSAHIVFFLKREHPSSI